MNEKWLEIYKKYRKRKYERDREKLDNDFAARGLAQSGMREKEERWLKEDYDDEVAMKQEEAEIHKEESKERKTSIWTNRILALIAILSFFATLGVSYITIKHSKENLELNYLPSIDVQYSAPSEDIQVYNRGKTNLYIWGSSFSDEATFVDDKGRLITPNGLPYHFPGKNMNQILATLLSDKENTFVPFGLFFKDDRGKKYVSKNYFFVFRKGEQMAIDVQTTDMKQQDW